MLSCVICACFRVIFCWKFSQCNCQNICCCMHVTACCSAYSAWKCRLGYCRCHSRSRCSVCCWCLLDDEEEPLTHLATHRPYHLYFQLTMSIGCLCHGYSLMTPVVVFWLFLTMQVVVFIGDASRCCIKIVLTAIDLG